MIKGRDDFTQEVLEKKDDIIALYFAHAFGSPMPNKYEGQTVDARSLREMIKVIHGSATDMIELPFQLGLIETIADVLELTSRITRCVCNGEMSISMADAVYKVIDRQQKAVESREFLSLLKRIEDRQDQVIRMKQVGLPGTRRLIPEVVGVETVVEENPIDVTPRTPSGAKKEVVFDVESDNSDTAESSGQDRYGT